MDLYGASVGSYRGPWLALAVEEGSVFLYSVVCVLFVSNCLTADTKTKRFTLTTVTLHPDTTLSQSQYVSTTC